jgi:hypothetical protein
LPRTYDWGRYVRVINTVVLGGEGLIGCDPTSGMVGGHE